MKYGGSAHRASVTGFLVGGHCLKSLTEVQINGISGSCPWLQSLHHRNHSAGQAGLVLG